MKAIMDSEKGSSCLGCGEVGEVAGASTVLRLLGVERFLGLVTLWGSILLVRSAYFSDSCFGFSSLFLFFSKLM